MGLYKQQVNRVSLCWGVQFVYLFIEVFDLQFVFVLFILFIILNTVYMFLICLVSNREINNNDHHRNNNSICS